MQVPINAQPIIDRCIKTHQTSGVTAWHLVCADLEHELRHKVLMLNRATGADQCAANTQWLPYFKSEMLCTVEDNDVTFVYVNGMWLSAEDAMPDYQLQRWAEILSEPQDNDSDRLRDERADRRLAA